MNDILKIHTLGTCSGTQPIPCFHHTSLAFETEKGVYFFDAGECGGYTAHINGVDLLKTKAVFISHPHMDHVGGLGNLLWYIRKVNIKNKVLTDKDNIDIYTPCIDTVNGFMTVLKNTEGNFKIDYTYTSHEYSEGLIYDNGDIKVWAIHTNHIPPENNKYISYGFKVEYKNKIIVFSGDMRLEDIDNLLEESTDVFLVETGHHQIEDICSKIKTDNKIVKKLIFVHHGGYIMKDIENARLRAKKAFGKNAIISTDGKTYEV